MATHSVDSTTSNANEVTLERWRECYRDSPSSVVKEHVKLSRSDGDSYHPTQFRTRERSSNKTGSV